MNKPLKISFDIGGVLSKNPALFREMMRVLEAGGAEVYVLTDIPDPERAHALLAKNGFDVKHGRILCADWNAHGDMCKAVLAQEHGIQLHIDDFPGYSAGVGTVDGCVSLFTWPDPHAPYYHEDFVPDDATSVPDGLRRRKPKPRAGGTQGG